MCRVLTQLESQISRRSERIQKSFVYQRVSRVVFARRWSASKVRASTDKKASFKAEWTEVDVDDGSHLTGKKGKRIGGD
jgi:hypothetical protein